MNKSEMAKLLGVAAAFDNRKVDEAMVEAWHAAIGDFTYEEAQWGLTQHYRFEPKWAMPGDVTDRIFAERDRQSELRHREIAQRRVLEARKSREEFELYQSQRAIEAGAPRVPVVPRQRLADPVLAFADAMRDMEQMISRSTAAKAAVPEPDPVVGQEAPVVEGSES